MWFSLHSDCHKLAAARSNSLRCSPDLKLLQFPHPLSASPVLLTLLLFFPLYFHPTEFFLDLYISFQWSGTSAQCQLLFCNVFCIWDVFLMHPWREIYSMSNYSSAILFFPQIPYYCFFAVIFSPLISVTNCLMLLELLCRVYTYSELLYLLGLITESSCYALLYLFLQSLF